MDDRIHEALDGQLNHDRLSNDEAQKVAHAHRLIEQALRTIPPRAPDLTASVMQRIAAQHQVSSRHAPSPIRALLAWIWQPRPLAITWRPAYALAFVLLLSVGFAVRNATVRPVQQPEAVLVHFRLDAPTAQTVMLAGEFTDWKPAHQLNRNADGSWTIVVPLTPGVHDYAFVVDGKQWVNDPAAARVDDGFGGTNSRVAVLMPDRTREL